MLLNADWHSCSAVPGQVATGVHEMKTGAFHLEGVTAKAW